MNKLEIEFFEEYKSVDNICRDMFQTNQGITEYINQMERMDAAGSRKVSNWREKYKMLKHLRWLRNKIAHESGAPELVKADCIELQHFRKQLLKQQDPLAELMKSKSMRKSNQGRTATRGNANAVHSAKNTSGVSLFILFCIVLIVGVLAWIFLMWNGIIPEFKNIFSVFA